MHQLIKQRCDKQVSREAGDQLGEILERFAGDVAEEAIALAKEDGYQTVKEKHVWKAIRE
jgi:histone H3/H4